jgi:8-oxo-dGTP pyrophosphatase MutT (NUDIX family)
MGPNQLKHLFVVSRRISNSDLEGIADRVIIVGESHMSEKEKPIWSLPDFEDRLQKTLRSRRKKLLSSEGLITAAVLVPLFSDNGNRHVLLTKRSDFVEHHRGEISFPGGKVDPSDANLLACALRETAEEIGVNPKDVRVLGELDDFYTVATGFLVIPFVGIIPYPYEFRPSAREIAGLLKVPLEVFFDPSLHSEDTWIIKGEPVEVISYLWEGHNIWGATARIMKHFTELIEASVHGAQEA